MMRVISLWNIHIILIGSVHTDRLGEVWAALSDRGLVAVEFGVNRAGFEATVRKQTHGEVEYAPGRVAR